MFPTAINVFVGCVLGNFIWQAFGKRDWSRAAERSFFMAVSLIAFLLAVR